MQIAKICNVTTPTIHNWIKKGVLQTINFPNGRKKISKDKLQEFLTQMGMNINLDDIFPDKEEENGKNSKRGR